jgi:hypothetical protein
MQEARTSDAFLAPKCSSDEKQVDRQRKRLIVSPKQLALEIRNRNVIDFLGVAKLGVRHHHYDLSPRSVIGLLNMKHGILRFSLSM